MTNKLTPTPAQIQEACDLMNDFCGTPSFYTPEEYPINSTIQLISHLIAERNAERQRVSEIVANALAPGGLSGQTYAALQSLILPDPEPTPEEVLEQAYKNADYSQTGADFWRSVYDGLAVQGYELRKIKRGDDAG